MIKVQNLSKTYSSHQQVTALKDVTLSAEAGDFIAVTGASGSGKSTLLSIMGGMMRPDEGQVLIADEDIYSKGQDHTAAVRAEKIGFIFQQFHLIPYLSIEENILAPLVNKKVDGAEERAHELMKKFGLLDRKSHRPDQLSTGEQQRCALARALITSPKLLLADEPTGNLDDENSDIVLEELAKFAADNGTVIMVTHDKRAANAAAKYYSMNGGVLSV